MPTGRARASSVSRTGHHRRVRAAIPAPSAAPATTSELQCTPTCTREYATLAASGASARPSLGLSSPTAVANAAAEAACPDGNDDDVGGSGRVWYAGSSEAAGRRRGSKGLHRAFAVALASAMASTPRPAALRVTPRRRPRPAATANQRTLWFAAVDTAFIAVSNGLGGSAATPRVIRRSISLTGSAISSSRRLTCSTLAAVPTAQARGHKRIHTRLAPRHGVSDPEPADGATTARDTRLPHRLRRGTTRSLCCPAALPSA